MVHSIEIDIFIPEEKLGMRLEDDMVIKKKRVPFNLMGGIPIEELMNS